MGVRVFCVLSHNFRIKLPIFHTLKKHLGQNTASAYEQIPSISNSVIINTHTLHLQWPVIKTTVLTCATYTDDHPCEGKVPTVWRSCDVITEPAIHNTLGGWAETCIANFVEAHQARCDGVTLSLIEERAWATGSDRLSGDTFPLCSENSNKVVSDCILYVYVYVHIYIYIYIYTRGVQ